MVKEPTRTIQRVGGFTLLELILATLISSLVIGILSTSLTFSLRIWERQKGEGPSELPMAIDLMSMQVATFDATPLSSEFGATKPLFSGNSESLVMATDYSVKAVSRGAPVVARYVYSAAEKKLYYAEIPLDPYHSEDLREFLESEPDEKADWPKYFVIDAPAFSINYIKQEAEDLSESWENEEELPKAILVVWKPKEKSESYSKLMRIGYLFSQESQK